MLMRTTPCLAQTPKTVVSMDVYPGYERYKKHRYLWRENVDAMTLLCPQKTRKGICEYPVDFTAHRPIKLCVTNTVH